MTLAPLAYTPFLDPLPAWSTHVWPWLLLPLCAGVAIVYKSTKCKSMRRVPAEAAILTVWIVLGLGGAAAALSILLKVLD